MRAASRIQRCTQRPAWLGMAVALSCTACNRIEQAQQCRTLVTTVNAALDSIEQRQQGTGGTGSMEDIATRYERLAAELERLQFSNRALRDLIAERAQLYQRTAAATRTVATGLAADDLRQVAQGRHQLAALVREEKTQGRRIDSLCHAL